MIFLCLQLDRHLEDVPHSSCIERRCSAYQTTEATYETKHVENGCGCVFANVGNTYHHGLLTRQNPWLPLRLQQIPLITFVDDRLVVIHMSPLRADISRIGKNLLLDRNYYVTFSHVWAHGRGNPEANASPACQLRLLQVRFPT